MDLKEDLKFLLLLRTQRVVREPKAATRSSMNVLLRISLSGLRSIRNWSYRVLHYKTGDFMSAQSSPCMGRKLFL